jgi:PAS domain-containing protein
MPQPFLQSPKVNPVHKSDDSEAGRRIVRNITGEQANWRGRLAKILSYVCARLPFDRATFGVYSENVCLFRPMYIEPFTTSPWPTLWMELPAGMRAWLESGKTWAPDIEGFVEAFPSLRNDPVVRQHLDDGLHAFVTLPVAGPGGPTSSLSLASRDIAAYDQDSLLFLDELGIGESLLVFEREIIEERVAFRERMKTEIRDSGSIKAAAEALVNGLHDFFHWNHVSIIRIDRQQKEFSLLCQSYDPGCQMPEDFRQPISDGMLGATLHENPDPLIKQARPLIVEDTRPIPRKYDYKPTNDRLLSTLTYPLRLNREWRWIILAEAAVARAFHGPDTEAMHYIVSELEVEINRLYAIELYKILLETTSEGVVVVDSTGSIRMANRTARETFFGDLEKREKLGMLEEYAGDETSIKIIEGKLPDTSRRLVLRGIDERSRTVLATRKSLPNEFQSSVWFFTDLENLDWNAERRYLRAVVNDVAQQTRAPLMLASFQLQRLVERIAEKEDSEVRNSVGEILTELAKADITFERLAVALSAMKEPIRESTKIDPNALAKDIIEGFPQRDRAHIKLLSSEYDLVIHGDPGRLRFVIRCILEYLLRRRAEDDKSSREIRVKVSRVGPEAVIGIEIAGFETAPSRGHTPTDPLWTSEALAHDDAGLGLEVILEIVGAHGGWLRKTEPKVQAPGVAPDWVSFTLGFPSKSLEQ